MEALFIIVAIAGIVFGVIKFTKKKKVEELPTTRRSYTGGDTLPTDKVDSIQDEELKPE